MQCFLSKNIDSLCQLTQPGVQHLFICYWKGAVLLQVLMQR